MKSKKNSFIKFWYTLVLVANEKEHSDAELVLVTSNGTYTGKPVPNKELEESFINQTWEAMLKDEKSDSETEEISLLYLKDVRKIDDSEKYASLTIFAEDIIGISGSGNFNFSSEN
ncbi:hypothetical protein [Lactococcus lactis]|uniref:hypothetical protein n=1 Tax=Lactococcus lactis TaxID=1358 RepID=UPI003F20F742